MKRLSLHSSLSLLLLLLAACTTTEADLEASADPSESKLFEPSMPWTTEFLETSVLMAEEIHLEGPSGLLRHFAARVEEPYHERHEETLPEGYQQTFTLSEGTGLVEMRGYLDRLELVATKRMTVLERPGDVDVVVEARGDVFYSCPETQRTERGNALRLVGPRPGK